MHTRAGRFDVTLSFLLQNAAWLYERQLSQVRAQMRRVGRDSAPAAESRPGSSSQNTVTQLPSRPSYERGKPSRETVRRVSIDHPTFEPRTANQPSRAAPAGRKVSRSPSPASSSSSSSSSDSRNDQGPQLPPTIRRPSRFGGTRPAMSRSIVSRIQSEEDDEDSPAFLPLSGGSAEHHQDQTATVRGAQAGARNLSNNPGDSPTKRQQMGDTSSSSTGSAASPIVTKDPPASRRPHGVARHRAELAGVKKGGGNKEGSDGTPSMSSSFSDLGGTS